MTLSWSPYLSRSVSTSVHFLSSSLTASDASTASASPHSGSVPGSARQSDMKSTFARSSALKIKIFWESCCQKVCAEDRYVPGRQNPYGASSTRINWSSCRETLYIEIRPLCLVLKKVYAMRSKWVIVRRRKAFDSRELSRKRVVVRKVLSNWRWCLYPNNGLPRYLGSSHIICDVEHSRTRPSCAKSSTEVRMSLGAGFENSESIRFD